jgi:hypothetical protein
MWAGTTRRRQSPLGKAYGTILWESKHAQKWSDAWLQKLKDDQLAAKADVAVIVSNALPDGMNQIGHLNGIWCSNFASVAALGTALRHMLVQVAEARCALVGKGEKMELIYEYLSGPEFRQRVEAIVGAFNGMRSDLENEKAALARIWARREKQIERVILNTAGLYGEIEGVTGAELPKLQVLELPAASTDGKGRTEPQQARRR